ncbi:GNAT family N-acetyltransferase [Devosia sp.]|uniref:GNAT family N-acetyltransferase n=1 Tax=Devosia sp. TaxID=1871048 RepID=UPI001AC864F6|nr:GNAT family N-acetyltransferase [Devosia sp.]MBN9335062.1 GNAT family N-acetyltransferase [Devosia sp.]
MRTTQSEDDFVLETPRLILRRPTFEDYSGYATIMQSPRSVPMGGPLTHRETWGMFCHCVGSWTMFGYGALVIVSRATGADIGMVSVNGGPLFTEPELGWYLFDGFEGHGYATEAAAALRDWALNEYGLPTLVSYFAPDNEKSLAVARRLGGKEDHTAVPPDPTDLVYRYAK